MDSPCAGESLGQGHKALFNMHANRSMLVLFGDGSLRSETRDWAGAAGTPEDP